MPQSSFQYIRVAAIATVVPKNELAVLNVGAERSEELANVVANTGVHSRRIVAPDLHASDLREKVAEVLLAGIFCDRNTIDLLAFITQTPDHVLPATACVLHGRLGQAGFGVGFSWAGSTLVLDHPFIAPVSVY